MSDAGPTPRKVHAGDLVQDLGAVPQDRVQLQETVQSLVEPVELLIGEA